MDRPRSSRCLAPVHEVEVTVFVAVELSRASWLVGIQPGGAKRPSLHRLKPGDAEGLARLIERTRHRLAATAGGRPARALCCYEAGYDGFWLSRYLTAAGIEVLVVDPASLQVNRRARRAKTDRVDAVALLRALIAYDRGDRHVWSVVRVPSVDEEDAKRTHRERRGLLKEKGRHINRIKGLCAQQGIYGYEPTRADRRARLEALVTGDGRPLPPRLKRELARELTRLELVLALLREVEAERDAQVDAAGGVASGTTAALAQLKGVGVQSASVLAHELFYRRFDNRREVAAYAGLAPSPYMSGAVHQDQGIDKAGNPLVRTTMVELAWLWVRYQPDSALSQWFAARIAGASGRLKRIMIVALARKLLVALWRYLEAGLVPAGARLKA